VVPRMHLSRKIIVQPKTLRLAQVQ
jgi:hypothetical protein